MLGVGQLVAFVGATAILVVAPGPSVLAVISRAIVFGRRSAAMTALGGGAALAAQLLVVGFGLGAVIADRPGVLTSITLVGAVLLAYLGVQGVRRRKAVAAAAVAGGTPATRRAAGAFRHGVLVGVVNPKRLLIPVVVVPQFVAPTSGYPTGQLLALTGIAVLTAITIDAAVGVVAAAARGWLSRSVRRLERVGGLAGAAMVAFGAYLAVSSQLG